MSWLAQRLREQSTYIGLIVGVTAPAQHIIPEARLIAEVIIPLLAATEVAREES